MEKSFLLLFAFTALSLKFAAAEDFNYYVGIKPFNFSMIDLSKESDFLGSYFGFELERKISKSGKLTFVLPVTVANLKTILISDYHRTEHEIFATTAVCYYPNSFNKINGLSFGAHVLLGRHSSESGG